MYRNKFNSTTIGFDYRDDYAFVSPVFTAKAVLCSKQGSARITITYAVSRPASDYNGQWSNRWYRYDWPVPIAVNFADVVAPRDGQRTPDTQSYRPGGAHTDLPPVEMARPIS